MTAAYDPRIVAERRRRGMELQRTTAAGAALAVLSTFNDQLLTPYLVEALHRVRVSRRVRLGPFGQLEREILDPSSETYAAEPAEVVLLPAPEDMLSPLFDPAVDVADPEALVDERLEQLEGLVETLLAGLPAASCLLGVLGAPAPSRHVLTPLDPDRRQDAVMRFNDGVRRLGSGRPRVAAVDFDWHARSLAIGPLRDERLWYFARMRFGPPSLAALADLIARHIAAFQRSPRKLVAIDLDQTLWGGIVGEVGVGGIVLGGEGTGLAFQDFQRELLRLHSQGVLLAICSKNNRAEALEAIERHPGMVLQREHFAAARINWEDKASNLSDLADELGLGLDSFVFLDDNPVEREWVRAALPAVLVPDIPSDPVDRPSYLADAPWFDVLTVTEADRHRPSSYQAEARRREYRGRTPSFEEFLASLDQEIEVLPLGEATIGRAAQLAARTNQFNTTTRRESATDFERLMGSDSHEVYLVAVRDRFGDSGITGIAVLRLEDRSAHIDSLLLSCRVLGRLVEDALLAFLAERARARGARLLVGHFQASERNAQAASFYPDRGFDPIDDGIFTFDLHSGGPPTPQAVRILDPTHA